MVTQTQYLSATETFEQLCKDMPSHHLRSGLIKTGVGIPLLATTGALAYGLWELGSYINSDAVLWASSVREYNMQQLNNVKAGLLSGIGLSGLVIDALLACGTEFVLDDGIISMKEHFSPSSEGQVYWVNDGFSRMKRRCNFSNRVVPVESVADLSEHAGSNSSEFLLVNGLEIEETGKDIRFNVDSLGQYDTFVRGKLGGEELNLYVRSNLNFAERIAAGSGNGAFCLVGPLQRLGKSGPFRLERRVGCPAYVVKD